MLIQLSSADHLVVVVYFAVVLFIGFRFKHRRGGTLEDYLLAGRRLTLPLFVGTLVSTWYGGIFGVGEISYDYGLVNWLTQGGFWYATYLLFAFFLAARLRRSGQITLPDQLERFYDRKARGLGLVLNFFNVVPIAYVLSLGVLLQLFTNWDIRICIVIGTSVAIMYSLIAGFRGVVYTDFLQFILMCIGVALVIPFAFAKLGGAEFIQANVPSTHLTATGTWSVGEIIVWGFIAVSTLVDPNFYQRCYAAEDEKVAKHGILFAVGFWMLFDVCTTFSGIYARAAEASGFMTAVSDHKLAYPMLASQILPPVARGIFFTGMVATIMSTIDSYCFVAATTLSRDLYQKLLARDATEDQVIRVTRWAEVFTALLAMGFALVYHGSIKSIWKTMGSFSTAAMLAPMLFGFFHAKRHTPTAGFGGMLAGVLGVASWLLWQQLGHGLWLEPLYPGLALSVAAYWMIHAAAKPGV